jgi:hypothetical protein
MSRVTVMIERSRAVESWLKGIWFFVDRIEDQGIVIGFDFVDRSCCILRFVARLGVGCVGLPFCCSVCIPPSKNHGTEEASCVPSSQRQEGRQAPYDGIGVGSSMWCRGKWVGSVGRSVLRGI